MNRIVKITTIVVSILVALGVFVFTKNSKQQEPSKSPFTLEVVSHGNSKYSYQIYNNKKLFIKQAFIPAVPGHQKFKTKAQAQLIGELVIQKLEQGQIPSISKEELQSNGIEYQK